MGFAPATAAVLELDWSGPEPGSVTELEHATPLRLTHHAHGGRLSYYNVDWVLPKSYRVLGRLPLLHTQPSNSYTGSWRVGYQLALQRSWDRSEAQMVDPAEITCTADELSQLLDGPARPDVLELEVGAVDELDCAELARTFPHLQSLSLTGKLGTPCTTRTHSTTAPSCARWPSRTCSG